MARASLSRLTYSYPAAAGPALAGVDWEVEPGLTLVTGDSGSGKSTLLRVLNGLVPHFHGGRISGHAQVAGLDVFKTPPRRLARHVGFVFQDPELQFVCADVDSEVAFGLENIGFPAVRIPGRVEEALARVNAVHLGGRRIETLSGGERQRVALASTLALRPEIVALDEPASQLDAEGAGALAASCRELAKNGCAVVVAEQRTEHFAGLADRMRTLGNSWPPDRGGAPVPRGLSMKAARPAAGPPAWSLRDVTLERGGRVLVESASEFGSAGEVVAVTGPNGSGKTTLLRVLSGLLKPASGAVQRVPGRIAYLPQNPAQLLHQPSVRAEVELTLKRSRTDQTAGNWLDELGLASLAQRYPQDLSSGERQRAALAAVVAGKPALVMLDEPTRGMDARARDRLGHVVHLVAREGAAVVMATHDRLLADEVADRILEIRDMKLLPV